MIRELKDYLYRTRWTMVLIGVIAFMTHGSILFSQRFGIDTDYIMNGSHNFDLIGRQGLVWLAYLLGLKWFNLYYAQILTFLFVILAPVSFGYLFYRTNRQSSRINLLLLVLCSSFIVSPFWVAQIYFLNQSAQILFACMLIAASLLLVEMARLEPSHRWYCILPAVVFMNIIFACYQVLIVVYVTGAAVIFLLDSIKEERGVRQQLRWIGFHVSCFLAGVLSYLVLSRLFFMDGGNYLLDQIAWTRCGASEGIRRCVTAIGATFCYTPPYYSGGYGIYALLLLGGTAYRLITAGGFRKGNSVLILLAELFLIFSPHIFIVLYGGELLDRMQLVMPLSQGSMLYLTITLFPDLKAQKSVLLRRIAGVVLLGFVLVWCADTAFHLNFCNRFYYTDEWVFQYDTRIAQTVYGDIQEVRALYDLEDSFDNYLFLGYPEIPYDKTALKSFVIGWSSFQYDAAYLNRSRIVFLMRNLGYPLEHHFSEGEEAAFFAYFEEYLGQEVDAMSAYPSPGYVRYLSNDELGLEYVVIKLGEDWRLF